jgi:DNA-binding NtrC family response regulator
MMQADTFTLIVCDDDPLVYPALRIALKGDFEVIATAHGQALLQALATAPQPHVVLLDIQLRDGLDGLDLLEKIRAMHPATPIIMYSGLDGYDTVVRAMRLGATDFVPKGASTEKLRAQLRQAAEQYRARLQCYSPGQANEDAAAQPKLTSLVGESRIARELRDIITRVADLSANILVTGESGTGKEVVARLLRRTLANGKQEPFIAVDSSTIQTSLAESALFGHERGSFTGADKSRKGLFEEADGGTIYFDEIGNMSMDIQAKLLRAVEEHEVTRVGSYQPRQVQFRVISATNRDLEVMCCNGDFRHDLYYRLGIIPIHIAPLRQRREDIPLLLEHLMRRYVPKGETLRVSDEAMGLLVNYGWPGNVRELASTIQYILALHRPEEVLAQHLPPKIHMTQAMGAGNDVGNGAFSDRMKRYERLVLKEEFLQSNGNIAQMARNLALDRSNLYKKLRLHGIVNLSETVE